MTDFTQLGLAQPLLKALAAEGYSAPTPIQTQAIPIVLAGRDLVGLAQTGTGKTAAFALPVLQRLSANRKPAGDRACRTLVLAPTRELATQISLSFRAYGRFMGLSVTTVFGGASMHKQKEALRRGVDILVATPGRLLDHVEQRTLRLDNVEILILDEADHMLDMGFIHDLNRIARLIPKQRQTLLFSATMPEAIAKLAAQFLTTPERVAVTPVSSTTERIQQTVIHVPQARKQELLHKLLQDPSISRGLVFTRTKHGANRVAEKLEAAGHVAAAIHGNRSQGQRERALADFRSGQVRLLVATEIAARGIDVDLVTHVINFDLPNVPEQYVHRIGRTARAGAEGRAVSFCAPDERPFLRSIEKLIRVSIPAIPHDLGEAPARDEARPVERDRPSGDRRQGRSEGRSEGRPQGRPQGRPGERSGERFGQRSEPRSDRRPEGERAASGSNRPAPKGHRKGPRPGQAPGQAHGQATSQPAGAPAGPRSAPFMGEGRAPYTGEARRPADGQPQGERRAPPNGQNRGPSNGKPNGQPQGQNRGPSQGKGGPHGGRPPQDGRRGGPNSGARKPQNGPGRGRGPGQGQSRRGRVDA